VHARAGRLAAAAHGPEAVMAGDVAHQLGHARAALHPAEPRAGRRRPGRRRLWRRRGR
jgi:hypothetical protein